MNNNYSGLKKNLDNGICVQSIRTAQKTGNDCDLKTCVQCKKNADKIKLSEVTLPASTGTNRSTNDTSQKNMRPIDIFIKWLTPEKKYVLKTLKGIKDKEPETFEKMKQMSLRDLSNFIFDDIDEQRSFNEFALKFYKGADIKLSHFSNREIMETISQMREIRREIGSMTEVVVKPLPPQRAAAIKLSEEFQAVKSNFVAIENELAPKNSIALDTDLSDYRKIEGIRHVREKLLSDASRKKTETINERQRAKDEHAKFLSSPEGIRRTFEERHATELKSSYDYEFGR